MEINNTELKQELENMANEAIKDISKLNKDLEISIQDKRISKLIAHMFGKGSMLGLDWSQVINYFKDIKEIKYSTNLNENFHDWKKALIIIRGKNLTLDGGYGILEKNFSNIEHLEQFVYNEDKNSTDVEFLLMR